MKYKQGIRLIKKGFARPDRIIPYILKKVGVVDSKSGKKMMNGVVTWDVDALESGNHWGGGNTPVSASAFTYHCVQNIRDDLHDKNFDRALEIGCGYGRITPWLSEFATDVYAFDPNIKLVSSCSEFYPEVGWLAGLGQNVPINRNKFDLVFLRAVLQHIDTAEVYSIAEEIDRITVPGGYILLYEDMANNDAHKRETETYKLRTREEYADIFDFASLINQEPVDSSAEADKKRSRTRLLFKKPEQNDTR